MIVSDNTRTYDVKNVRLFSELNQTNKKEVKEESRHSVLFSSYGVTIAELGIFFYSFQIFSCEILYVFFKSTDIPYSFLSFFRERHLCHSKLSFKRR